MNSSNFFGYQSIIDYILNDDVFPYDDHDPLKILFVSFKWQ